MKQKQLFRLFVIIAIFGSIIGCQKDVLDHITDLDQSHNNKGTLKGAINYCGDPAINILFADQDIEVGTVTVGNTEETLFVTFSTSGDWLLANTKVFVGLEEDIPITKTGNPIRGKFTENDDHDPFITSITYSFPLAELDEPFVIAAHACVVTTAEIEGETEVIEEEGAWGFSETPFGGKAWGWYLAYEIQECTMLCPESITDSRDGHVYNTILIGNQCWMQDNLAYMPHVSPPEVQGGIWVYGYEGADIDEAKSLEGNYEPYGCLYDWNTSTTDWDEDGHGNDDICPVGWHLPSYAEWDELIDNAPLPAGNSLKEVGNLHWEGPSNGTNLTGFTALPGGTRSVDETFFSITSSGNFWSSRIEEQPEGSFRAYTLRLTAKSDQAYLASSEPNLGFSVRCIMD